MEVLVIGGAGYIGAHVVYELIAKNYQVVILDDLSTGQKSVLNQKAKFYLGDVQDKEILEQIFQKHNIQIVIHLAAKLLVGESVKKPIIYYKNNVNGLITLIEIMVKNNVKNIIFSSTAAVYGIPQKFKSLQEEDVKNPINPYGSSKLSGEYFLQAAKEAYGINYVIFRYFNVAGANVEAKIGQNYQKKLTHLIPNIISSVLRKENDLEIYGNNYPTPDKTCIRDYIHVNDLASAHILGIKYILENKSNIFNLGLNRGFSIKEVIKIAEKTLALKIPYKISPKRAGDGPYLVADATKANQILQFKAKYSLEDMIKSEYLWFKNQIL